MTQLISKLATMMLVIDSDDEAKVAAFVLLATGARRQSKKISMMEN